MGINRAHVEHGKIAQNCFQCVHVRVCEQTINRRDTYAIPCFAQCNLYFSYGMLLCFLLYIEYIFTYTL